MVIKVVKRKVVKKDEKWWKRPPRSSRVCFRCKHKYSSHIDVRCLKIVKRKPDRIECNCKGFVSNEAEMNMIIENQNRRKNMLLNDEEDT